MAASPAPVPLGGQKRRCHRTSGLRPARASHLSPECFLSSQITLLESNEPPISDWPAERPLHLRRSRFDGGSTRRSYLGSRRVFRVRRRIPPRFAHFPDFASSNRA